MTKRSDPWALSPLPQEGASTAATAALPPPTCDITNVTERSEVMQVSPSDGADGEVLLNHNSSIKIAI